MDQSNQNNLEKYASEAYKLVLANDYHEDQAETYAGAGFRRGAQAGAAVGAGAHLYDVAAKGMKLSGGKILQRGAATAALWGVLGGLGGGAVKRKEPVYGGYQYE